MNKVLERIYKRTTEYSHPSQATTTANALDLLSSGIYTEEERFIFELLQNAVDSFDANDDRELRIKIVLLDDQLIFMHNGAPFSERDLEGLCDIGNGNKMNDAKKIGYKGIGFKSVFMHSHLVAVLTNGTCFKFDKKACEKIVKAGNYPAKITATTDRVEALKGADGVLCTILNGDVDVWQYDILIPYIIAHAYYEVNNVRTKKHKLLQK
mgnify:CR=1 FL=1